MLNSGPEKWAEFCTGNKFCLLIEKKKKSLEAGGFQSVGPDTPVSASPGNMSGPTPDLPN